LKRKQNDKTQERKKEEIVQNDFMVVKEPKYVSEGDAGLCGFCQLPKQNNICKNNCQ
jgi:hypothetical protein